MNGLRRAVGHLVPDLHRDEVRASCHLAVLDYIERVYAGRPLCLVVDDATWLDELSQGLLLSLCRAQLSTDVVVAATGWDGDQRARWPNCVHELTRAGLTRVTVPPLDRDAVVDLVAHHRRALGGVGVNALADRILRLSDGVPDVVGWWLDRPPDELMGLAAVDPSGTGYAAVVDSLAGTTRHVGAIAALLGSQFNLTDLQRLADRPVGVVEQAIDDLVAIGLVTDRPEPEEYRFLHTLVAEALGATLSASEASRVHAEAYATVDDDRRRAWHGIRAGDRLDQAAVTEAMVSAARIEFQEGNHLDADAWIRAAEERDRQAVGFDDRIMGVEAAERSGRRATERRADLVTEAVGIGKWPEAAAAALTGLPDTEILEGDLERVAALQMIEPGPLPADTRVAVANPARPPTRLRRAERRGGDAPVDRPRRGDHRRPGGRGLAGRTTAGRGGGGRSSRRRSTPRGGPGHLARAPPAAGAGPGHRRHRRRRQPPPLPRCRGSRPTGPARWLATGGLVLDDPPGDGSQRPGSGRRRRPVEPGSSRAGRFGPGCASPAARSRPRCSCGSSRRAVTTSSSIGSKPAARPT